MPSTGLWNLPRPSPHPCLPAPGLVESNDNCPSNWICAKKDFWPSSHSGINMDSGLFSQFGSEGYSAETANPPSNLSAPSSSATLQPSLLPVSSRADPNSPEWHSEEAPGGWGGGVGVGSIPVSICWGEGRQQARRVHQGAARVHRAP